MNFRQPSTAGPLEAAKMLAFLGDMDFVRNIFAYLTSYCSGSPNKALIFLNLSPLLVHYMNFCADPAAVHPRVLEVFRALVSDELEQAAVVRNAEILLQSLEFYRHERELPLAGPLLEALGAECLGALGLTLQNVVFTQLRLFGADLTAWLERVPPQRCVGYLNCLLAPELFAHPAVRRFFGAADAEQFADFLVRRQRDPLAQLALSAALNQTRPSLSDPPARGVFELLQMCRPTFTFVDGNLHLRFFLGVDEALVPAPFALQSDFECPLCYFGTCTCHQVQQHITQAAHSVSFTRQCKDWPAFGQILRRAAEGVESSGYVFRGRDAPEPLLRDVEVAPELYFRLVQTCLHDKQTRALWEQQAFTGFNRCNSLQDVPNTRKVLVWFSNTLLGRRVVRVEKSRKSK